MHLLNAIFPTPPSFHWPNGHLLKTSYFYNLFIVWKSIWFMITQDNIVKVMKWGRPTRMPICKPHNIISVLSCVRFMGSWEILGQIVYVTFNHLHKCLTKIRLECEFHEALLGILLNNNVMIVTIEIFRNFLVQCFLDSFPKNIIWFHMN